MLTFTTLDQSTHRLQVVVAAPPARAASTAIVPLALHNAQSVRQRNEDDAINPDALLFLVVLSVTVIKEYDS
jgi:hypothetical protein